MKTYIHILIVAMITTIMSCSDEQDFQQPSKQSPAAIWIRVTDENGQDVSTQGIFMKDNRVVSSLTLKDGINELPLSISEPGQMLVVEKEGFEPYVIDASRQSTFASHGVINVILKSVIALSVETYEDDDTYQIELDGTGPITIVWPDGTIENAEMPISTSKEFDKGLNAPIVLKGNLVGIKTFIAFGYNSAITNLFGLKSMTNLEAFLPGKISLSQRLDLTHNRKLATIDLFDAKLPHWLKLPAHHNIKAFTLSLADRNITAPEVGYLIDNIVKNAVKKNITRGNFSLTGSDPALPKTLQQIATLEDKYGWTVELNL